MNNVCECSAAAAPTPERDHGSDAAMHQPFVTGRIDTPAGPVPLVASTLRAADRIGDWAVRWGIRRYSYRVLPGLYAVGAPNAEAPVLVTANYKLTFDLVRQAINGLSAWLLVLDTRGINVWCAAGKGTFGTGELAFRVQATRLADVVSHRKLIVPQLGAPGVSAFLLPKRCGFHVVYGPIQIEDLKAFIAAGMQATPAMRQKTFPFGERLALVPMELVGAFKYALILSAVMFCFAGLGWPGDFWSQTLLHGGRTVAALMCALVAGAIVLPLGLPYLPGRAFATKGMFAGLLVAAFLLAVLWPETMNDAALLELGAYTFFIMGFASFMGMNFTGASTYTSLSGVLVEMRAAVPKQAAALLVGLSMWILARFFA